MSDMGSTRKIPQVRRKKKKKGAISPKMIYWLFVLGISMLLSAVFISTVNEVFALQYTDEQVTFTIPEGASLSDATKILKEVDLISNRTLFSAFFKLTSRGKPMRTGDFTANMSYDYRSLTKMLTRKASSRETVRVTIPEGYEVKQIIKLLVDKGVCEEEDLKECLKNGDFEYDFLKGIKKGSLTRLEGYLYPDTYEFYVGDKAENVIKKLLSNFKTKFTDAMAKRAKELGFSTHELITLASIIEREATSSDRELISSVFHNRLESKSYPYLESCATVQYILGERKARITIADTEIDSPYNTYENKGLPPGPIASPGLAAIEAALYPADTEYLFFAVSEEGKHSFSKTYEEHLKHSNINPK